MTDNDAPELPSDAHEPASGATPEARSEPAPSTDATWAAPTPPLAASDTPSKPLRPLIIKLLVGILVPILVLAGLAGWSIVNRQYIADQIAVWNYDASPGIDSYVDDSSMVGRGLFLFQASKPRIAPDTEFNDICGSNEGGDGVIGCYTPNNKRITLFEITDVRLGGLKDAVASHEMLHAAWDRLGDGEREHLIELLTVENKRLVNDEDYQSQLSAYGFASDEVRYNELHSIIGTEVLGISDELERYYAQYFSDRDTLVKNYQSANDVLVQVGEEVTALSEEIETLDTKINDDYKKYKDGYRKLNKDVDAFNARNNAYYYTSQSAFDRDRNALIARQKKLDKLYKSILDDIDLYDDKVATLTDLDKKAAELFSSINIDAESSGL
jgi:hypothetical protein